MEVKTPPGRTMEQRAETPMVGDEVALRDGHTRYVVVNLTEFDVCADRTREKGPLESEEVWMTRNVWRDLVLLASSS